MIILVTSSARHTETNDNLLTAGQNGLNIMRNFFSQLQIKNYTHSNWLGFGCPVLYVTISILWGKQMPPDLAVLLAFSIETVDWLDNSKMTPLTDLACSGVFFQRHAQYRQVDRVPLAECLLCGGENIIGGSCHKSRQILVSTDSLTFRLHF